MGAFGYNFSGFRAIWLGTTKSKLQNRYRAAHQNIQTFMSNLSYIWLTKTSWIDSAPSEPSNSSQSGHTGTNVASFPITNISWKEETASCQFSATLGRDSFTSVRLQDKSSGATDSGRPLLPLWPIFCLCRWSIRIHCGTKIVFTNIWGHIRVPLLN
jgi:hypothetical protein